MRLGAVLPVVSALSLLLGCSGDDDSSIATSPVATIGLAATVCADASDGEVATVTINVDDDSDGFGRFGLRTPNPLHAGSVRLSVDAAADNPDAIDVSVVGTGDGAIVFEFVQVQPGVQCATVIELVAGDYTVSFGDSAKTFTVTTAE